MNTTHSAIDQIQDLLGPTAIDDATWQAIRTFESTALERIEALWPESELAGQYYWHIVNPSDSSARLAYDARCAQVFEHLRRQLGEEQAAACAAVFSVHPQLWQPSYTFSQYAYTSLKRLRMMLLSDVAAKYVEQSPPPHWPALLAQRVLTVSSTQSSDNPDLNSCIQALLRCDPALSYPLVEALVAADWAAAWIYLCDLAGYDYPPRLDHFQELWQQCGAQHAIKLLRQLYRRQRLEATTFRQLLETIPNSFITINHKIGRWSVEPPADGADLDFAALLRQLTDQVIWEMLCDFRTESVPTLLQIRYLSGGRTFLRVVEEIEQQGVTLSSQRWRSYQSLENVLGHLLSLHQRHPDDDSAELTRLLRCFKQETLLTVLPHTGQYERELCLALGWAGCLELTTLLRRLEEDAPARSADPGAGTVHPQEILNLVQTMDATELEVLLAGFEPHRPAAVTMVRAAKGLNRKELRRLLGRRNQLAARALGLLPLDTPDELLKRYLLLVAFHRDASSSSAGKKAYERAAAQAGLTNLAWAAGFSDATRLEWAMQDKLGADTLAIGRQWEIEGYTLKLALGPKGPTLHVRNGERTLKRTPAAVTRAYEYREVRATVEQAKDQERRYRDAFLESMRRDQPLSPEEIALLSRHPLATNLLERLVLLDEAGACGLFRAEEQALEGTHGELVRITGAVRIAHPYVLAREGVLVAWQAEVVRRKLVQPFKQLFRELYILTPAELEAQYSSSRLSGRRLKGRQAIAVLANLGWLIDGYATVRKPFYDLGYAAHFETGSYGFYDGADDGATTGQLSFQPLTYQAGREEQRITLSDVPPLVLSEVLRDLDLVTVIAHQSEEHGSSKEVINGRADLVRALVAALGLTQVQVEEPYVHVRGSLASYRIQLTTGAIYMASGQYLCIVPSSKQQKSIYLPFEDGREPITSEIISKTLLLVNDTQIVDQTIRSQIALGV